MAAARVAAFLRRKYAKRRLRLARTRCCCPMESLSDEMKGNAISIKIRVEVSEASSLTSENQIFLPRAKKLKS
jgi:hypothetical protein